MKTTIVGGNLIITIPIETTLQPSASGKTLCVATSHGNQKTGVQVEGREVIVGVNAYIKR